MKKRLISLLLVFAMMLTMFPVTVLAAPTDEGTVANSANPFTDVKETDWFYDAVQYVRVNGIFKGTTTTTFDPNGTMTRGMFATVLGRMAGVDTASYKGQSAFTDVPTDAYYAPYVTWAAKHGITEGTGDGKFSPDALINRAQLATFFVRYFEAFGVDYETGANVTTTPVDMDAVPTYAKDAVLKLWRQGLLNGDGANFNSSDNASRAQTAALCMRTDEAVDTWYREPGVVSDRVRLDPATGEAVTPDAEEEQEQPSSGGATTTTYYQVSFEMGTGQSAAGVTLPESKTYPAGTEITLLPTPYKQNGLFLGWYYDAAMTNAVDSEDTVTKNMTLYAKMGEVTPLSAQETPNYITVTVPTANMSSYTFGISDYTADAVEYFNHVSDLNSGMEFTVDSDGTVKAEGGYKAGQTYSVKLTDDSSAVFVVDGEAQPASIRVLNIITEKAEVQNLTLDGDVKYLPYESVSNMNGTALDGLFTVSTVTQTMTANKNEGSFTYDGADIAVGDTVAIYEGTKPDLRKAVGADETDNDGAVAYVKITEIEGNTYHYQTADSEEVLFTPDVLPIPADADTDGSTANNSITVSADVLDFTDDKYTELGLDSQTVVEQGDFIALYSGAWGTGTDAPVYGKITSVTEKLDSTYEIAYTEATDDEVLSAMDIYSSRNREIELTDEEKRQIESSVERQAVESGFVEESAEYLTALAIETDGFQELSDDLDMDLTSYSITFAEGSPVEARAMKRSGVKAEITEKSVDANVLLGTLTHFEGGTGIRVELVMTFKVEVGSGDNKLVIELQAIFEQEVMLTVNVSGGAIWKKKWIFPYIYDYQMNANIDVGTYTGIGITATARTQGKEDDPPAYDWKPVSGTASEAKIIDIGKQVTDLMEQKEEFMGELTVPTVGTDGEETESSATLTSGGLAEKYAAMMENAEESWIDILRVEIFSAEGHVDPFHILCYGIGADFVVQANLYVTLGMTFEYGVAKRYNFSLMLFHKKSTSETIDLEEAHYRFDFYVMGTIGIRAGIELEVAVGLFSLKLDSIGICAEVGAYARLWGYFYYSLSWTQSGGKTSTYSGAMLIEIGLYLEISFKAQLFSSEKLTYQPTLYENEWPLWSIGEAENVYDFAYEEDDDMLSMEVQAAKQLALPSDLFMMNYMDMKSGELYGSGSDDEDGDGEPDNPAGNFDDESESRFTIELSNPKFSYNADGNVITVRSGTSVEETCEVTITWKHGTLAFSSRPIRRTLTIEWSDPENLRYISFNPMGGSTVNTISGGTGAAISAPASPTRLGYDFDGWYTDKACTDPFSFPSVMPDYLEQTGEKGVTVYAKWSPRSDTPYTVRHYWETADGSYVLHEEETLTGTTMEVVRTVSKDYTAEHYKSVNSGMGWIAADGSTVLNLYYDRIPYTVTFTYGDYKSDENKDIVLKGKKGDTLYTPSMALRGYDLVGFADLTTDENDGFIVNGDATYNAQWMPRNDTPYRVEHYVSSDSGYVLWSGDTAIRHESGTTDAVITLDDYKLTSESYLTYKKATVNGETVTAPTISADGNTVVKLYYDRKKYSVQFDTQGGIGTNTLQTVYHGDTVRKPADPTKTNCAFGGWYTDSFCTAGREWDFTTDTVTAATILYAKWTDVTYTVETYEMDVSGQYPAAPTTETTAGTPDETVTVTPTIPDGFILDSSASVLSGTVTADNSLALKVYLTRNRYTISFDTTGGSAVPSITDYYQSTVTAPANPTRIGYAFTAWDKTIPTAMPAENVTITAVWEADDHTITWNANGGKVSNGTEDVEIWTQSVEYDDAITAPAAPTKEPLDAGTSYIFKGWTTTAEDNGSYVTDFGSVTGDATYYAQWETTATKYTVTWKDGDTTLETDNDLTWGSTAIEFNGTLPTRESTIDTAYPFDGWYTEPNGGGEKLVSGTTAISGDVTYYAHFTEAVRQYAVTFKDGDSTMSTPSFDYNTSPSYTATKSGYTFLAWNTVSDGSGIYYSNDSLPAVTTEGVTYYAQWVSASQTFGLKVAQSDGTLAEVNGSNFRDVLGNGTVSFDPLTDTLTLNGYTFNGKVTEKWTDGLRDTAYYGAIMYRGKENGNKTLNIVLEGSNTITNTGTGDGDDASGACGLCAYGNVAIGGEGSLTILAENGGYNYAIRIDGDLTVTGGSVTAEGGTVTYGFSRGLFVGGTFDLSGGTVTAKSSVLTYYGRGVEIGLLSLNGGTLTATGGQAFCFYGEDALGAVPADYTVQFSLNSDGTEPVNYVNQETDSTLNDGTEANNTYYESYKWFEAKPTA